MTPDRALVSVEVQTPVLRTAPEALASAAEARRRLSTTSRPPFRTSPSPTGASRRARSSAASRRRASAGPRRDGRWPATPASARSPSRPRPGGRPRSWRRRRAPDAERVSPAFAVTRSWRPRPRRARAGGGARRPPPRRGPGRGRGHGGRRRGLDRRGRAPAAVALARRPDTAGCERGRVGRRAGGAARRAAAGARLRSAVSRAGRPAGGRRGRPGLSSRWQRLRRPWRRRPGHVDLRVRLLRIEDLFQAPELDPFRPSTTATTSGRGWSRCSRASTWPSRRPPRR